MGMSAEELSTVKDIHHKVFENFTWVSDYKLWARKEHWTELVTDPITGGYLGDCEDFAMTVEVMLIDAGISYKHMRVMGCYIPQQNDSDSDWNGHKINHIVLGVKDSVGGIWVSDCNTRHLTTPDMLPYVNWCHPVGNIDGVWVSVV